MARSFSQHGVWGLTKYAFSSTSSSLLYTFLLSVVYRVAGVSESAPLILNIVFAYLLLYVCDFVLGRASMPALPRAVFLGLIVFGMPLAPEVMAGMEHILHTVLTIAFVYATGRLLLDQRPSKQLNCGVLLFAMLVVLARYEALALVYVAAIFFFARGRRWYSIALVAAASIPIALFGAYSVANGWFPVPNSIIAKASRPEKSAVPYPVHWAEQLWSVPAVAFLVVIAAILLWATYRRRRSIWNTEFLTLSLFFATALIHMQFARVGWFYRYEAYLVVLGIYSCAVALRGLELTSPALNDRPGRSLAVYGIFTLCAIICFEPRAVGSLWLTPWATRNIYEQQYQMGRFLRQNYAGTSVVMNDIGAAGFLSDARIVDLYGLSTVEVARAKIHHRFTQSFRRTLAANTDSKIAVVYSTLFDNVGGLPPEWIRIGSWRILQNQICWGDTVSFYAIDPGYRDKLIADLRSFEGDLPKDVVQTGLYIKSAKNE
jgi:hypothetical protein